jgi:hypothetical protein
MDWPNSNSNAVQCALIHVQGILSQPKEIFISESIRIWHFEYWEDVRKVLLIIKK